MEISEKCTYIKNGLGIGATPKAATGLSERVLRVNEGRGCSDSGIAESPTAACLPEPPNKKEKLMEKLILDTKWDKTFKLDDSVSHKKVTFTNHFGITLAADMYTPTIRQAQGPKDNRKLPAIAVCGPFGAVKEQVLDANLLSELVKVTKGTMFDANGLSGNRWTSEMNLKLAEQNGFDKIGKMQIVSEENFINMPVNNPYLLKYARSGKEFGDYDTLIAVHRVRGDE